MCNEGDEERMIICIFSELDGQGSAGTYWRSPPTFAT